MSWIARSSSLALSLLTCACGGDGPTSNPDAAPGPDAAPVDCTAAAPPLHALINFEVGGLGGDWFSAQIGDRPQVEIGLVDQAEGGCVYVRPGSPFCDPACTDGVCGLDEQCHPYPQGLDAGTVTTTGTHPELSLEASFPGSYFPDPDVGVPFGFTVAGETIGVATSGGEVDAFSGSVVAVAPLELPTMDVTATEHEPMTIGWEPTGGGDDGEILIQLRNDHHGINSYVECLADDAAGQLTIPTSVLDPLIADGATGIGTYIEAAHVQRRRRVVVPTSHGCAAIDSSSLQYLSVTTVRPTR